MKVVVIIQARMGSSRLPGKTMMPLLGQPMLARLVERLRYSEETDEIVVATTTESVDDVIEAFCLSQEIKCFRGSEGDVLSRYAGAAKRYAADIVVRVTSDCPLLDPALLDQVIRAKMQAVESIDLVSNMLVPSYPYGMAVEVFSFDTLALMDREATQAVEREHVTPFLYWNPERFRLESVSMTPDLSHHRWTVDTVEDYRLVNLIFETLYPSNPRFTIADILALLKRQPEWVAINSSIKQHAPAQENRV